MPPAYTSSQKSNINEFASVTQADKTTAGKLLKQYNWNVGAAVNAYFNNPVSGNNPVRSSLAKTFDKYRDSPRDNPDEINTEGTSQLLAELQIGLEDIGALVFSEIVQSPSLGTITREGFVDGFTDFSADTVPKMRNAVLQRRSALPSDRETFKSVYNHTFTLALQERQKALPIDTAEEFWRVLFSPTGFEWRTASTPWLDWWIEFNNDKVKKAVNKDLWRQTLTFATETMKDESLGFWTEDSSWPSVIDEFVEHVKTDKRMGGGVGADGDAMEMS